MLAPHCESVRHPGTQVKNPSPQPSHNIPGLQSESLAQNDIRPASAWAIVSSVRVPPPPQATSKIEIRIPPLRHMDSPL
jgi:hypothetical protein